MRVSSVATRLYPDASQLLASATGPPKMVAWGDTAQTLDPVSSQSSSVGKMKFPDEEKSAWTAHDAPVLTGQTTCPGLVSDWGLTSGPV